MRQGQVATMVLALAVAWAAAGVAQQTAEQRFQAGLYQEEVQGNLQRAIAIYEEILNQHGANRAVAAKAQLHIGLCYETLGLNEAQRAYQRVVDDYADQTELAQEARARLAALQPAVPVAGRGPVARRLLTNEDTDIGNFIFMTPSPDGRRVAYVTLEKGREGRLFVRDLASGAEEQLLPGLPTAMHLSPAWSPDGTRLAFAERVMDAAVASVRILDLASRTVTAVPGTEIPPAGTTALAGIGMLPLQWSRDGRFLLYRRYRDDPGELGIVAVAGGAGRVLAESVGWGSLSPDGRYVAYTVGEKGSEQVFVQSLSGGTRRRITSEPGGNRAPVWSPDGNAIAYFRRDGIWTVPVAGGDTAGAPRLAYASVTAFDWREPVWTATGGLYLVEAIDDRVPHRIAVDPATRNIVGAAERLPPYPVHTGWLFRWSPDMQHTAFSTWAGDVVIAGADGSSVASHRVAPYETLGVLAWSGDGREVFCFYWKPPAGGVVAAVDVASGRVREMTRWTPQQQIQSVTPDGRRMLFKHRPDQDAATPDGLVIVEPGSPGSSLVVPWWDADSLPLKDTGVGMDQISLQGDRVAFARSAKRGSSDDESLWIVGSDGTGLRRIATIKEIGSILWDPSGRFIAYTGTPDSTTLALRVVEAATGVERSSTRLSSEWRGRLELSDWSHDGRFIGFVTAEPRMEYWVVQGLLESGR
jgi:Tol biopolymer transport system component